MKRFLSLLLGFLLTMCWLTSAFADVPAEFLKSTLRRKVVMPNGAGPFQYYAQNDPVWDRVIYEARLVPNNRPFGDGGCNPTSLAMIIASLVDQKDLTLIQEQTYENSEFIMCVDAINEYRCRNREEGHAQTHLKTPLDFALCLPLVLGNYATGNNKEHKRYRLPGKDEGLSGGTSFAMVEPVAKLYGLHFVSTRNRDLMFEALDNSGMVLALLSGVNQPFSGTNGHYVVICSYDKDYIYVMDPFIRDEYKKDRRKIIEDVELGIKKVKISNMDAMCIGSYAIFQNPARSAHLVKP